MSRITSTVTFVGELEEDPAMYESRSTGQPYTDFVVSVSESLPDEDSWPNVRPTRWNVRCFAHLARNVNASLAAGDRVSVTGRVTTESYLEDGSTEPAYRLRVVADVVAPSLESATVTITRNVRPRLAVVGGAQ